MILANDSLLATTFYTSTPDIWSAAPTLVQINVTGPRDSHTLATGLGPPQVLISLEHVAQMRERRRQKLALAEWACRHASSLEAIR